MGASTSAREVTRSFHSLRGSSCKVFGARAVTTPHTDARPFSAREQGRSKSRRPFPSSRLSVRTAGPATPLEVTLRWTL